MKSYLYNAQQGFSDTSQYEIAENLLSWYDLNARRLPWRIKPEGQKTAKNPKKVPDPYRVWLSEVMLQQTTVATVKTYFEKFLTLWPTVEAMAASPQEDILQAWAGLGYYARARNLHKCARIIAGDFGGIFPASEADLKKLPGIGDYTAAAIAAIAFGQYAVVVDSNVERVVSRLNRLAVPLPAAKKEIRPLTAQITPKRRAGDFAQAVMDLGASICTPKKPDCLACPLVNQCQARQKGDMEHYPVKAPKKTKPVRRALSFALVHGGDILLERRPQNGLLGGMPGLFHTPWVERPDFPDERIWSEHIPCPPNLAIAGGPLVSGSVSKHTFTHFHLETKVVLYQLKSRINVENAFWQPLGDIANAGLPTVFLKMARLIS